MRNDWSAEECSGWTRVLTTLLRRQKGSALKVMGGCSQAHSDCNKELWLMTMIFFSINVRRCLNLNIVLIHICTVSSKRVLPCRAQCVCTDLVLESKSANMRKIRTFGFSRRVSIFLLFFSPCLEGSWARFSISCSLKTYQWEFYP